jgi:hypothetical protein
MPSWAKGCLVAVAIVAIVAVLAVAGVAVWWNKAGEEYEHDRANVAVSVALDRSCPRGVIDPGARVRVMNNSKHTVKSVFYEVKGADLQWLRDFKDRIPPQESRTGCIVPELYNVNADAAGQGKAMFIARTVTVDFEQ